MLLKYAEWPREYLTELPCPPGLSHDMTEQALFSVCYRHWKEKRIPVIAWGGMNHGLELYPPVWH